MGTNVKKIILIILIIIDLITIRYANVYSKNNIASQIYNNVKNSPLASIDALKNINIKNTAKDNQTIIKQETKQEVKNQIKQTENNAQDNSQIKDNNQQWDLNKSKSEEKVDDVNKENCPSNKSQLSRGGSLSNLGTETDITLTFYTSLSEENGGYTDINCTGAKLTPGTVANNVLPLGTKIYTNEFGTLTVLDRGGDNFDTIHRLDVFIPRNDEESDWAYKKRVNDMGKVKVKGYIVKQ